MVIEVVDKKIKGRLTACRYCKSTFRILPEDKQNWFNLKNPCPNCGVVYCNLSPSEKKLQELQSTYYENGKQKKDLQEIYNVLLVYCKSLCLKLFRKSLINDDDLVYFSHKATWKVIEQYISDTRRDEKEFKITDSFSSYTVWKLRESIYEKEEHDCGSESLSQVKIEEDYEGNYDLGHYDYSTECSKLKEVENDISIEGKNSEIEVYFNSIIENGELKLLSAILNYIKFGDLKSDLVFQYFGNEGKARFLYIMKQFRNKLSKGHFA